MPGNSPYEAVDAFLKPLQRAISCLGSAKISTSPRGKHQPEMLHGWTLNGGAGMTVQARDGGGRLGVFKASMHYEIVLSDNRHEGKWRVSTRGYAYELVGAGDQKTWSMHWHPVGRSGITSALPSAALWRPPAPPEFTSHAGDGGAMVHRDGRCGR